MNKKSLFPWPTLIQFSTTFNFKNEWKRNGRCTRNLSFSAVIFWSLKRSFSAETRAATASACLRLISSSQLQRRQDNTSETNPRKHITWAEREESIAISNIYIYTLSLKTAVIRHHNSLLEEQNLYLSLSSMNSFSLTPSVSSSSSCNAITMYVSQRPSEQLL